MICDEVHLRESSSIGAVKQPLKGAACGRDRDNCLVTFSNLMYLPHVTTSKLLNLHQGTISKVVFLPMVTFSKLVYLPQVTFPKLVLLPNMLYWLDRVDQKFVLTWVVARQVLKQISSIFSAQKV